MLNQDTLIEHKEGTLEYKEEPKTPLQLTSKKEKT